MSTICSYSSQPSFRKKQTLQDCEKNKKKKRLKAKPRDKCSFCLKLQSEKGFTVLINKALYSKYASSQNFYYMKDINDYLEGIPSSNTIKIKDYQTFDRESQKLKRFYYRKQFSKKIEDLTQYFKFYKEVPRIFLDSISKIMARYNQKKRAEEYKRIKIFLNLEDQEDQKQKVQDKLVNIEILKGIDLSEESMRPSRKTHEIDSSFTMYELKMKLNQIIKEEPSKRQIYDFLNSRADIENCSFDFPSINQISIIKGKDQETLRNFDTEKKKEIDPVKFYKRKSNPSPNISMNIHKLQMKPKLQKKIIKEKTKKQQKEILSKRISQEHLTLEKKTGNLKKKKDDRKIIDVFSTETSVEKKKLTGLAKIKGSIGSANWPTKQRGSKNIDDNMKAIISLQNLKSKLTFTFNDYKIEGFNANKLDGKEKICTHVRTNSDQFSKYKQKIKGQKKGCKHKYTFSECLGSKITINQNNFVNIILKKEQDKKLQLSRQKWKKKEKK